jgi:hypothetical protein
VTRPAWLRWRLIVAGETVKCCPKHPPGVPSTDLRYTFA